MIMTNRTNILINDSGTDFSAEGYAALGVLLEMVWGIQTMGARMARALDEIGARNCLVQRKKQAFNDAKKSINGLLKGLEAAFDETLITPCAVCLRALWSARRRCSPTPTTSCGC